MTYKHIIKKQILDFTLDSPIGSFTFQSEAGALYKNEIVPLIEEYCNAIGSGQEVIRIDKLEMDLGRIDKRCFGREFKRKFAQMLPQKLAEAIRHSQNEDYDEAGGSLNEVNQEYDRGFAVLEFFIYEGCLPWWVGSDAVYEMPDLLQQTIATQPAKVKQLVAGIIGNAALVKRLVYHADDGIMAQIIALFQPLQRQAIGQLAQELLAGLGDCPLLKSFGATKLRPEVWHSLLWQAVAGEGKGFNRQFAFETLVKQLVKLFGVAETVLLHQLEKAGGQELAAAEMALQSLPDQSVKYGKYGQQLENVAQRVKKLPLALMEEGMYSSLVHYVRQLETLAALLNQFPPSQADKEVTDNLAQGLQTIRDIMRLLESLPDRGEPKGSSSLIPDAEVVRQLDELEALLRKLQYDLAKLVEQAGGAALSEGLSTSEGSISSSIKRSADPFSVSAEIYVGNAGLVLLWPYLPRFFDTLGLVGANRFVDESAAERAVLLLHYLACGTAKVQEYELTLNKIICGMEAAAPVEPHLEMTEAASAECENLLKAVILNWPALKNLSPAGLRSLFLQREGLISTRDGQPVLRVAGAPCDILLNQIPWGIGTVKLPWMEQLLLVEWGVEND